MGDSAVSPLQDGIAVAEDEARDEVRVVGRPGGISGGASGAVWSRLDWPQLRAHDVVDPAIPEGISTMLHAWWNTNMDARRSISLLIDVAGLAVVALGLAASPVPLAFGGNYAAVVGPVLGATVGGYLRHRVSDPERAPLWALAYGASVAAILVATFGTAAVIRPTVHGIPGLGDAASGIIVTGFLVAFVGALLWERDARRRRFAALLILAVLLIVGGVVLRFSGDLWALIGAFVSLGGFGVLLVAFESYRRSSRQDAAVPDTWR